MKSIAKKKKVKVRNNKEREGGKRLKEIGQKEKKKRRRKEEGRGKKEKKNKEKENTIGKLGKQVYVRCNALSWFIVIAYHLIK